MIVFDTTTLALLAAMMSSFLSLRAALLRLLLAAGVFEEVTFESDAHSRKDLNDLGSLRTYLSDHGVDDRVFASLFSQAL